MKILVTGGAGFIGSHIVDHYIRLGNEVFVVDDLSTGDAANVHPKATLIAKSFADKEVREIILRVKPDLINHHAAQVSVRKSVHNPLTDLDINLRDTVRLLQTAGEAGVKKIIFASSGGTVYGETSRTPLVESYKGSPISPYGINKLTAEFYLLFFAKQYGFRWTILRYANVYGPRQGSQGECGVISIFVDRIRNGLNPIIFGDGEQVRDYIHVQDVVSANQLVSEIDSKWNEIFNVGTGVGTTLNRVVSILQKDQTLSFVLQAIHHPPKPGDLEWNILDIGKLQRYGWKPLISVEEGIKDLLHGK